MTQNNDEAKQKGVREMLASALVGNAFTSRADLMTRLFDERRDIDDECGYPKAIDAKQYRYMYDREGIATRVVSVYPEECWKNDPLIYETEEADVTSWEATLEAVIKEHNIMHYLNRIDELSGVGSFGILLIGVDDGKQLEEPIEGIILDGANAGRKLGFVKAVAITDAKPGMDKGTTDKSQERPMTKVGSSDKSDETPDDDTDTGEPPEDKPKPKAATKKDQPMVAAPAETQRYLLYLRAIDESLVDIAEWENDPTSRRYGMPKAYNVKFNDPVDQSSSAHTAPDTTTKKVHWTRVIHVADNAKSSEVFGTPRMQNVFNRLYDLRKLLGGSAEMFWKGAFPGFSFEVNPDLTDVTLDTEGMRKEFEAYSNGLQRYLAVNGVTAKSLAVQVASPEDHVTVQLRAIAIAMKCPLRIFMGSEAAHLASTQDQKTWNGRLSHRQEKYLTPKLIRPFIDRLIAIGVLPEPELGDYEVEWPDMDVATDEEKAKVAEILVKAIAAYIQAGMDILVPPFEFLTMFIGLDADQAKAIIDAAADHLENDELLQDIGKPETAGMPGYDEDGNPLPNFDEDGNPLPPDQGIDEDADPDMPPAKDSKEPPLPDEEDVPKAKAKKPPFGK